MWRKRWRRYFLNVVCDGCCEREGAILFSPLCETRQYVLDKKWKLKSSGHGKMKD